MKLLVNSYFKISSVRCFCRHYGGLELAGIVRRGSLVFCRAKSDFVASLCLPCERWNYILLRKNGRLKVYSKNDSTFWSRSSFRGSWGFEYEVLGKKAAMNMRDISRILEFLETRIMQSFKYIPHGDVWMGNIILKNNEVFLIDNETLGVGTLIEDYLTFVASTIFMVKRLCLPRRLLVPCESIEVYVLNRALRFFGINLHSLEEILFSTCIKNSEKWVALGREDAASKWLEHASIFS